MNLWTKLKIILRNHNIKSQIISIEKVVWNLLFIANRCINNNKEFFYSF